MGLGRLAIAALLLWSGMSKMFAQHATREAALGLGVPRRLARSVGAGLPVVEVLLATALLVRPVAVAAMVSAAALFSAFTALVAVNLVKGRRPACHCFGASHARPIGAMTVTRNVVLTAAAVALVATRSRLWGPDPLRWLTARGPAALALALALACVAAAFTAESALLVASLRRHGRLLLRVDALETALGLSHAVAPGVGATDHTAAHGLAVGSAAPDFVVTALTGDAVSRTELLASGRPLLLVFTDASCGPCHALLPTVGAWQREPMMRARVAVVASGDRDIVRAASAEHQLDTVLHDADSKIATAFEFRGTPCAVVVDVDGTVASPMAYGGDAIRALAAGFTSVPVALGRREAVPAEVGAPAPPFRLPRAGGGELALDDFRGQQLVILFWNPSCGFCRQLVPELRDEERDRPGDGASLVLISSGTADDNDPSELVSPMLTDNAGDVLRAYGANGTPIAVLVDENATVASPLAVGGPAVLELLRSTRATSHHHRTLTTTNRDPHD